MKKTYTMTIALLCLYSATFSQTKGDFEFSGSVGLNYTTVITPQVYTYYSPQYEFGLNVAAAADYYFADRWSIKAKLIYDQKGWANGELYTSNGNEVTDFRLNYLTVPLLANWHFGRKKNWYLNFGPYVGFLMSATATTSNTDVKSIFNTTDGGIELGIGVKIPVSEKIRIFIEDDAQAGIANIVKQSTDGSSIQNSRGSISVGVNVNLSKNPFE